MIQYLTVKLNSFFDNGHARSSQIKKNIFYSLILKGLSMAIGFLLIPITINYINPSQFGLWLTLSSIIGWLNFFDIGLANGLKNKLAESSALGQTLNSRIYVSTTYAILGIISLIALVIFLPINPFLNWESILNVKNSKDLNLNSLVLVVFITFCVQFVFQIINTILTAWHVPSKVSLIAFLGQLFSATIIYILSKSVVVNLVYIVAILAGVPLLIQIIASIILYKFSLKSLKPSFKFVDFKYAKDLLQVGGIFFIIQIGALILVQTDNIIIIRLFGPKEVTTFNVAFKLYSIITMIFTIVITPFWSAFTDAYARNDLKWIHEVLTKMQKYWLVLVGITILMFFSAPFIYKLWLKDSVELPTFLSFIMALWVIAYSFQTMYVYFLNGIGKIRLQLYLIVFTALINIPLAIVLSHKFGIAGVTLSNTLIFIFLGIIYYIQTQRILNKTATGIFNK